MFKVSITFENGRMVDFPKEIFDQFMGVGGKRHGQTYGHGHMTVAFFSENKFKDKFESLKNLKKDQILKEIKIGNMKLQNIRIIEGRFVKIGKYFEGSISFWI